MSAAIGTIMLIALFVGGSWYAAKQDGTWEYVLKAWASAIFIAATILVSCYLIFGP